MTAEAPEKLRGAGAPPRNPVWSALTGSQAALALGEGSARRFRPEYIPFGGVESWDREALGQLGALLSPGESLFLTSEESALAVPGLRFVEVFPCWQMQYVPGRAVAMEGAEPTLRAGEQLVMLGPGDVPEMLALKKLAFPGFFGERAPALGTYYGLRVGGELVAMAGERLWMAPYREVNAVCTHPSFLGRGYAARLVRQVVAREIGAGEQPVLHVQGANARAIALYERLGFVLGRELLFHEVRREP